MYNKKLTVQQLQKLNSLNWEAVQYLYTIGSTWFNLFCDTNLSFDCARYLKVNIDGGEYRMSVVELLKPHTV